MARESERMTELSATSMTHSRWTQRLPVKMRVPSGFTNKMSVHPFTRLSRATPYSASGRNLDKYYIRQPSCVYVYKYNRCTRTMRRSEADTVG